MAMLGFPGVKGEHEGKQL